MSKLKKSSIEVQGTAIVVISMNNRDFISLIDMVQKSVDDVLIYSWMRNRNALEFIGIWEQIYNPDSKGLEFETFRNQADPDLQSVSGEDARAKTHFVLVDAVGVCESDKTESRPLDRQPTVPLKTLLQRVIFPGGRDENTLTTLAACLQATAHLSFQNAA